MPGWVGSIHPGLPQAPSAERDPCPLGPQWLGRALLYIMGPVPNVRGGERVTVEELVHRATGGRRFDRQSLFRPSLVYQTLKDPFWVWCEYHAPRSVAVDETTRYDTLRLQWGIAHEQAWIRRHYPDAVTIDPPFGIEALRNTVRAMLEGARAIYQPQLWDLVAETYGRADLLLRDDTRASDLGPYSYRLVEIKRSKSLRDYHVLDAAFYNRMLGKIQGYSPPEMTLVIGEAVEEVPYIVREKELDKILLRWRTQRDGGYVPEPGRPPGVTASPWRVYGKKFVEERSDLVLLAGVGERERERLRAAGIRRVDHLWELSLEKVCEMLGNRHGAQAYYVAQAYKTNQPVLKPGVRLDIPRGERHLYFDFESVDDLHPCVPPHVYLVGCWDAAQDRYEKFWAHGPADEAKVFHEFLKYVGDGTNTVLYHWTDYEITQMKSVIQRWPELGAPLGDLMASCVDLKQVIQSAVYLPVPSFSLKSVAPALGFRWRQENFDAFESMVCYWDYLDGTEGAIMDNVFLYNEDDCRAMWQVDRDLTTRKI